MRVSWPNYTVEQAVSLFHAEKNPNANCASGRLEQIGNMQSGDFYRSKTQPVFARRFSPKQSIIFFKREEKTVSPSAIAHSDTVLR
jgi:hypothetical protein